jgi:hypothetical protein
MTTSRARRREVEDNRCVVAPRHVSSSLPALLAITFLLSFSFVPSTKAQSKKERQPPNPVAKSKSDIVKAAREHRADLEKVLPFLEAEAKRASEVVERRKELFASGLVSKRELEESEQALSASQARIESHRGQIAQVDYVIAEALAAEQLARLQPLEVGGYVASGDFMRYSGPANWSLSDVVKVESFFADRFNRPLPVSAFGQTPVHERLGLGHHNSIDVAAHPDSPEGQALMAYLRSAGISFIAFRHAVPGSATGPHIHIGFPSRRLVR